jgi:hypothetical protein
MVLWLFFVLRIVRLHQQLCTELRLPNILHLPTTSSRPTRFFKSFLPTQPPDRSRGIDGVQLRLPNRAGSARQKTNYAGPLAKPYVAETVI